MTEIRHFVTLNHSWRFSLSSWSHAIRPTLLTQYWDCSKLICLSLLHVTWLEYSFISSGVLCGDCTLGLDQRHCAPLKGFLSHSFILPTHYKWPLTTVFTTISLLFSRISCHQTSDRPLRLHLHDSVIFCCIHPPSSIHLFSWVMLDSFRILISQPYSTYLCTVCLEQRDILWTGGKHGHFQWAPPLFLLLQPSCYSFLRWIIVV